MERIKELAKIRSVTGRGQALQGVDGQGYFHADPDSGKTPYTIVIPPPNITGQLHMGHALTIRCRIF